MGLIWSAGCYGKQWLALISSAQQPPPFVQTMTGTLNGQIFFRPKAVYWKVFCKPSFVRTGLFCNQSVIRTNAMFWNHRWQFVIRPKTVHSQSLLWLVCCQPTLWALFVLSTNAMHTFCSYQSVSVIKPKAVWDWSICCQSVPRLWLKHHLLLVLMCALAVIVCVLLVLVCALWVLVCALVVLVCALPVLVCVLLIQVCMLPVLVCVTSLSAYACY